MRFSDLLDPRRVFVLKSSSFEAAVEELFLLSSPLKGRRRETLLKKLLQREREFSTAIGGGVAIPHIRDEAFRGLSLSVGFATTPLDNKTPDNEPVRCLFLLLGNEGQNSRFLQIMAGVARLLGQEKCRESLSSIRTGSELAELFDQAGVTLDPRCTAGELMQSCAYTLREDQALREVLPLLKEGRCSFLPVIDKKGALKGEISAHMILKKLLGGNSFFSPLSFHHTRRKLEEVIGPHLDRPLNWFKWDKPLTVLRPASLTEMALSFGKGEKDHLYVVDHLGRLLGKIFCWQVLNVGLTGSSKARKQGERI